MRTGVTSPLGKLTESVKLHCSEDLRNAITYAAMSASRPVSETLRISSEDRYFGMLYRLRASFGEAVDPLKTPNVSLAQAIGAIAVANGVSDEECREMLLTEMVFGLFHAQRMASDPANCEGRNRVA